MKLWVTLALLLFSFRAFGLVEEGAPDSPEGEEQGLGKEQEQPASPTVPSEDQDISDIDVDEEIWKSEQNKFQSETNAGIRVEEIIEPQNEYHYASFGRSNPFVPPFGLVAKFNPAAYEIPIVSPLQVELSKLSVAGVWELDNGTRRALIMNEESQQGIIASVGDPIGPSGKIITIESNGIIARQYKILKDGSRDFQDYQKNLFEKKDVGLIGRKYKLEPGKSPYLEKEENNDSDVIDESKIQIKQIDFENKMDSLGTKPASLDKISTELKKTVDEKPSSPTNQPKEGADAIKPE